MICSIVSSVEALGDGDGASTPGCGRISDGWRWRSVVIGCSKNQPCSDTMSGDDNSGSDLSLQLANLLKNNLNQQPQNPKLSDNLQINLKLNSQNYALWTRMIRVAIGGKSKALLNHLTSNPPDQNDESFEQWEQDDLIVFSWLIQNIEPVLAGNLTEFPTAKSLWDALVVTYSSGRDKLQTLNLHVKANEIKQNDYSLEDLWITLQGIWGEIDRIDPNPMNCPEDINTYSKIRSEQKLFQFLNALDRKYDPVKREILRLEPLPTAEAAYATIRKDAAHRNIFGASLNETNGNAAGLIASETEGLGLVSKNIRGQARTSSWVDKSKLKCSECGMMRNTKEQCFKIVGFPDWWSNNHRTKNSNQEGKTTAAKRMVVVMLMKEWLRLKVKAHLRQDIRMDVIFGRGTESYFFHEKKKKNQRRYLANKIVRLPCRRR